MEGVFQCSICHIFVAGSEGIGVLRFIQPERMKIKTTVKISHSLVWKDVNDIQNALRIGMDINVKVCGKKGGVVAG